MHKFIKKGVLIKNRKGTFIIDDMEDAYVAIRDVQFDKNGTMYCGKRRIIGIKDLDNYKMV